MGLSNLSFLGGDIPEGSLATPGLFNRRFSAISKNLNAVNDDVRSKVSVPVPATSTDTSSVNTVGSIAWDDDFIYVLASAGSWKRASLSGY